MSTFIVFRKPGRAWVEVKATRDQPGWDEAVRVAGLLGNPRGRPCNSPVDDLHTFCSETATLFLCIGRCKTAVGTNDSPPWQSRHPRKNVAYGSCGPRETCLLRDLSVGRDVTGSEAADGFDHFAFEPAVLCGAAGHPSDTR